MKKYVVTIHTEEMKGRLSAMRTVKCLNREEAERVLEREYNAVARHHDLMVDEDVNDDVRVVEYFPRMRTTLSIAEA